MGDVWSAFVKLIADALTLNNDLLRSVGVPYSFGFAIILFTVIVKVLTLPLTFKQLQSARKMQQLQPEIQKLQKKYKDEREKMSKAQMELYKEAGVNPLGGCLPTLVQMPIWFALYQALFRLASEGNLNEGFLWIPSLAQPRDLTWIWPLPQTTDGWVYAAGLLVLPILTVVTQLVVQKMTTTAPTGDSQQAMMGQMMMFMPIMFGFFALQVPQGLVLYWVSSNLFMLIQQYVINKQSHAAKQLLVAAPAPPATDNVIDGVPVGATNTRAEAAKRARDVKRKTRR